MTKTAGPILRKDIVHAQANTRSHNEAARFMNIGFEKYKRWAVDYGLYYTDHMNRAGKGVSKAKKRGLFGLQEILDGKHPSYDRNRLKERLIATATIEHKCHFCGTTQARPDGSGPYILDYADGNRMNLDKDNLRLMCYNCRYLTTGRITLPKGSSNPTPDLDYEQILGKEELEICALRKSYDIGPDFKLVDTCAAEFQAYTPYYYSTYEK